MAKRIDETIPRRCKICDIIKQPEKFPKINKRKDGTHGRGVMCMLCKSREAEKYYKTHAGPAEKRRIRRKKSQKGYYSRLPLGLVLMRKKIYGAWKKAELGGWKPCDISPEELLSSFTGYCFVCSIPEIECIQKLHMDHNHETGEFRGWLCNKCNASIGIMRESPELLLRLAEYVEQGGLICNG